MYKAIVNMLRLTYTFLVTYSAQSEFLIKHDCIINKKNWNRNLIFTYNLEVSGTMIVIYIDGTKVVSHVWESLSSYICMVITYNIYM